MLESILFLLGLTAQFLFTNQEIVSFGERDVSQEMVIEKVEEDYLVANKSGINFHFLLSDGFVAYLDPVTDRENYISSKFEEAGDGCPGISEKKLASFRLKKIDESEVLNKEVEVFLSFNNMENNFLVDRVILKK